MLYNFNNNTFKLTQEGNKFKVYFKAENRWSSGWAYIGTFNSEEKARAAARAYSN
jgi:hypothetical protein